MIRQSLFLAERAWQRWLAEFMALLPQACLRRFASPRLILWLRPGDKITELAVTADDECLVREAIAHPAASEQAVARLHGVIYTATKGKRPTVTGLIPEPQSLARPLSLPLAAEAHLDEAVRYQIQRLSPFKGDNTLYDIGVPARDRAADELRIKLTMVSKAFIEDLEARGASLRFPIDRFAIEASDGGAAPEGVAFKSQSVGRARVSLETKALLAAAAILIATLFLVPIVGKLQRVAALEREVGLLKPKADQVMSLRSERDSIVALRAQVIGLKQASLAPLAVLSKLSELVDDGSFLFDCRMEGALVTLSGLSTDASKLAQRLSAVEAFKSVKFSGPVMRDPRSARDRFTLIIDVASPS